MACSTSPYVKQLKRPRYSISRVFLGSYRIRSNRITLCTEHKAVIDNANMAGPIRLSLGGACRWTDGQAVSVGSRSAFFLSSFARDSVAVLSSLLSPAFSWGLRKGSLTHFSVSAWKYRVLQGAECFSFTSCPIHT